MQKVEIEIMGRPATARRTKLKKVLNTAYACYCPICNKIMFMMYGVYRCTKHGYFSKKN